ncbi:type 2 lanthipeptide synthetase LanM family protein [Actinophytocola gossypii]|uniref:Type 2 lantipeptide synthetase LanM family protein n=1 Tax=Actinophytocola gossypii TaxID=2812003 RepID=A0ABT2JC66_9PSEU|nr:type 2 lanthipeptide synthetase LanM family protein [Actinophytocola gossypii]MCT2585458.1 type 2 lantipeptide synthetase LanM family protein [Actinophytocola gossypii]
MSPATRTEARPEAGALSTVLGDPVWWAPGLAPHERGAAPAAGGAAGGGTEDPAGDPAFAMRLTDLGLTDAQLSASPAALAARVPQPAWAALTERAVAAAVPARTVPADWRAAFARVLEPFVAEARVRVLAAAGQHVDLPRVAEGIGNALGTRLVDTAARTLVTELHRWRDRLDGADGHARFADFARRLTDPAGLGEVLARYPVLARLLAQDTATTAAATVELLDRLRADRDALVGTLLDGTDPGPVIGVVPARGDRHAGGRSVTFVDFADGRRVVYKPRDLGPQVAFAGLLAFLDPHLPPGLCPATARVLARPDYGWVEHVAAEPLADRAAADRFYRRQGALLALLHAVRATDVHYENLIAHGDQPVLVDLETLFHPGLAPGGSGDPAADALAASVHRTALLPLVFVGEGGVADLSGLGGDHGHSPSTVVDWLDAGTDRMRLTRRPAEMSGAANRPRIGTSETDPGDHEPALLAGFRQAYDAIAAHRTELADLVAGCADLRVRVVTRPTWMYATLLDETTHPEVLRDAVDRDRALSVLYPGRAGDPLLAQLLRHELADLWAGDVPMFTAAAGDGRLRTATGEPLPVPLPVAGLAAARDTIAALGEVDRRDQEWVVSATLATRRPAPVHPAAAPVPGDPAGTTAHPDELLAAACAVADRIVARGVVSDGRVNWLGLEAVEGRQWLLLPLGASLGNGYVGVAVFLAHLAEVTGIARYADQARAAVGGAPAFVSALATRPDLVAAIGCGGLHGLGGIAYGLARLGTLLDDRALTDAAARAVSLAGTAATPASDPGWSTGLAGCLAATTAIHTDLGLPSAADVARTCATHLTTWTETGSAPPGFADGLAGIGWALTRFGPDPIHRTTGHRIVATTTPDPDPTAEPGWCSGDAGLALAAGRPTAPGPVRLDLSLCHGELGVTEVMLASATDRDAPAARELRRRAGLVLEVLRRHGPRCGVPGGVSSPGLLTGLAGIGHGLLRLASPARVPSVLLLEPHRPLSVPHPR